MTVLYQYYLDSLLQQKEWNTILNTTNGRIGFKFRGYGGLVANNSNIQKPKQGLFDFFIYTARRYEVLFGHKKPTHYNLLRDLTMHSSLENCELVWRGEQIIEDITDNSEEVAALTVFSLMMFEQEINYGEENFQQFTQFVRPRDMLMGFSRMAFHMNIDDYPYWDKGRRKQPRCYPDFNGSFKRLELEYKQYFDYYMNAFEEVPSLLMDEQCRTRLLDAAEQSPNNPNYVKCD